MFTNDLIIGLPIQAWVEKAVHRVETHNDFQLQTEVIK